MIEAVPESIKLDGTGASGPLPSGPAQLATSLGRQTLVGEIVDSKCYLGVMNPGRPRSPSRLRRSLHQRWHPADLTGCPTGRPTPLFPAGFE